MIVHLGPSHMLPCELTHKNIKYLKVWVPPLAPKDFRVGGFSIGPYELTLSSLTV
jgi:hypothetical protein